MKELFWIMVGLVIGTVFHADIPVLNNISATKIKGIINNASEAVMEEPPPPPTKKELRKERKRIRKDKDITDSVGM
tara:strand:+ start:1159 stop:1386 length:228 start_codon:yes stop_codon:yes gene_type:complete